ncbi:uncharacterized protein LOC113210459 isoform X1 [Frankliniella occidentalis]|uniref:Uncharacterized protein LOC113210459 isoform X1 n=1 Tax=Frankliniella occidentalis TaxID=133901 RepID=A0A6J1SSJ3_FRAOC|nr:uncharacterized protein LOC113210459 isoform X1 [Frankliniella occidentalis]
MLEAEVNEAINCFADSLADLTVNSKPLINFLTMVAKNNVDHAEVIVDAVDSHLEKAPIIVKLPILYLIDSIVKNVATKYIDLFSSIIREKFPKIYEEADETMRQSMFKLRQTWDGIFSCKELCDIDVEIHSFDSAWLLKGESLDAFKNKTCKILLNPSFLSMESEEAKVHSEVDEADMLREQLLLQKQRRDLERDQKQTDQRSSEQKSSTSPADSTTIENSTGEHPLDDIVPINKSPLTDTTVQTKMDNSKLIHLLSDLVSRQNHKLLKDSEDHDSAKKHTKKNYQSKSHRNPCYDEDRRKSYRPSRYSNHRSYRDRDHRPRKDRYYDMDRQHRDAIVCRKEKQASCGKDDPAQSTCNDLLTGASSTSSKQSLAKGGYENSTKHNIFHYNQTSINLTSSELCSNTVETTPYYLNTQIETVIKESSERRIYNNFFHVHNSLKRKSIPAEICFDNDIDPASSCVVLTSTMVTGNKQKKPLLPNPESGPVKSFNHSQIPHEFSNSTNRSTEKVVEITQERIFDYQHGYRTPEKSLENSTCFNPTGNLGLQRYQNQNTKLEEPMCNLSDFNMKANYPVLSLPSACIQSLRNIAQDPMGTISVDGVSQEVRFYGDTAVIGAGSDNPREILFKHGEATIILNNFVVHCIFHEPNKEIILMGNRYLLRLGAPTRELYVNNEGFQCSFNCPPIEIQLSTGEMLTARLHCSAVPLVQIGALRSDLVAGSVTLSVNGVDISRIYLDGKPQRFDIAGIPHILKFLNRFKTVLINQEIVNICFGGPAVALLVKGDVYYVRLSHLPPGLILGQFGVLGMGFVQTQNPVQQNLGIGGPNANVFDEPSPHVPLPPVERKARGKGRKRSKNNALARKNSLSHLVPKIREQNKQNTAITAPETGLTCFSNESSHNNSTHKPPAFEPCANIHALFRNLCEVGLLTPHYMQTEPEERKANIGDIHEVDFSESSSLKTKQPGLVDALYSGEQCSSCGERFFPNESGVYSKHLDWHFQINREIRKPQSRMWYLSVTNWVKFESESSITLEVIPEECKGSTSIQEEPTSSVPSQDFPYGTVCEVCRDKFEEFFNEEQDEWHLKDCICHEGLIYHPVCLKDYQMTSDVAVNKRLLLLEDELSKESSKSDSLEEDAVSQNTLFSTDLNSTSQGPDCECEKEVPSDSLVTNATVINENYCLTKEVENTKSIFPVCESHIKDSMDETQTMTIPQHEESGSTSKVSDCESEQEALSDILILKNISTDEICLTKEMDNTESSFPVIESEVKIRTEDKQTSMVPEQKASGLLKSRLEGRKLIKLPPLVRGSDISNMCTVC